MADHKHIFDEHGSIIKLKDPLVYHSELDKELANMEDRINQNIDKKFAELNQKLDKKFDQIDKKFDQIDKKFDQIDKRFNQVDEKIDKKFNNAIVFLTFLITLLALFLH